MVWTKEQRNLYMKNYMQKYRELDIYKLKRPQRLTDKKIYYNKNRIDICKKKKLYYLMNKEKIAIWRKEYYKLTGK
jgi:hypothetical protein